MDDKSWIAPYFIFLKTKIILAPFAEAMQSTAPTGPKAGANIDLTSVSVEEINLLKLKKNVNFKIGCHYN